VIISARPIGQRSFTNNESVRGIAVGSKGDYENLNQFLSDKNVSLAPLVDRVFSFDESAAAFDYLYSGSHTGKVIIKVQD
jgi:threonine dehydrogenase-like Zn-dependent dehydrogenase